MNPLKQRFIELFAASGWSQAEAARRMDMTRGGVNGIVTGPTVPSAQSVKFLEMLMLDAGLAIPGRAGERAAGHPAAVSAGRSGGPAAELAEKLGEIQARDPGKFQAVKVMIESLHHDLPLKPTVVSYGTKPARKRLLSKATASVRKPPTGSGS